MNISKPSILIPFGIVISACSNSGTPHLPNNQISQTPVTQTPKASINITCQDLSNPAYQQAIMNAINHLRSQSRQCGQQHYAAAKPLAWNQHLYKTALTHSKDMSTHNFLGHVSSTGQDLRTRLKQSQFNSRGGAENVARGQKNLEEVLASWLKSPAHCSNMMHPKFTDYAIACTPDQSPQQRHYWTQQFGIR
ncbi:CAP domain-containing protein [Acinetobacter haemolyticus]|uniref:CAP domain-containing protein n=1 Tax=Acinetobacter haemolyticus TaxID=29430 RepID=UPI003F56375A